MRNIYFNFIKKIIRKMGIIFFDKELSHEIKKPINHILIINWHGKIGDAIVSSFFFREIKNLNNIKISVITNKHMENLYANVYQADCVYIVSSKLTFSELYKASRTITNVDAVIPLMGVLNFKDLFFISKLNPKSLFSLDDELKITSVKLGYLKDKIIMHDVFIHILNRLGVSNVNDSYIYPKYENKNLGFYEIIINPFASRKDKSLSLSKTVNLINEVAKEYPNKRIGILNSPDTLNYALEIKSQILFENVIVIKGVDVFESIIQVIIDSNIIISVDTSVAHIASGLGKKLIAIYYKPGEVFNQWLVRANSCTKIVYSIGIMNYEYKNMDNFEISEIIKHLHGWSE